MVPRGVKPIPKTVIPAAGFGTRMHPVTKVPSKEMIPIANNPLIQFAVEEVAVRDILRFGMLATAPVENGSSPRTLLRVLSLVEKPSPEYIPSPYGVFWRYLLDPEIFDLLGRANGARLVSK